MTQSRGPEGEWASLVICTPVAATMAVPRFLYLFCFRGKQSPVIARGNGPPVRISPCGVNPGFNLQAHAPGLGPVAAQVLSAPDA